MQPGDALPIGQIERAFCRLQRLDPGCTTPGRTLFSGRALNFLNNTSLSSVSLISLSHLAGGYSSPAFSERYRKP